MNHDLKISIRRDEPSAGIVRCRTFSLRDRLLRRLLGGTQRMAILVPGDSVRHVSITQQPEEGDDDDDNGAFHGWVYQLRLERRKCFKTMASVQGSAREKIPRSFSSRKCKVWKLRDAGVSGIGRRVGQRKRQRLAPTHAPDEPRVQ